MNKIISPFFFLVLPFKIWGILFLVLSLVGVEQVVASNIEKSTSHIHLDKSFYVSGEIIWYKLYLGKEFKDKSATIKAVVATPKGKTLNQDFFKTAGNTYLQGHYKIPFGGV